MGTREENTIRELWTLLSESGAELAEVYSDTHFVYRKVMPPGILAPGKRRYKKIERKHLTVRTRLKRLARKTICYSKSLEFVTSQTRTFPKPIGNTGIPTPKPKK